MDNLNIGINGFGRIGKCLFLQLLNDDTINIKAVNINNLLIEDLQQYINYDSIHHTKKYDVSIEDDGYILIGHKKIKIITEKNPLKIDWRNENVEYLFETTGKFLTTERAKLHDVSYVILSAPPKDIGTTPIYCYGVNENEYKNEKIISAASCTTNCIGPLLKLLNDFDGGSHNFIKDGNFITVHSSTSSQNVVDTANFQKRTNRSILNNIIPHTTGASTSLNVILPELANKIVGTSVRVPISNVSMVDINLLFEKAITKNDILQYIEDMKNKSDKIKEIIEINNHNLVSSDFIGNKTPTIIDKNSTLQLTDNSIKFTLWYDNEWSYTAQIIRLVKYINSRSN